MIIFPLSLYHLVDNGENINITQESIVNASDIVSKNLEKVSYLKLGFNVGEKEAKIEAIGSKLTGEKDKVLLNCSENNVSIWECKMQPLYGTPIRLKEYDTKELLATINVPKGVAKAIVASFKLRKELQLPCAKGVFGAIQYDSVNNLYTLPFCDNSLAVYELESVGRDLYLKDVIHFDDL